MLFRIVTSLLLLFCCYFNGIAQQAFEKGSHTFLVGYGFQNRDANNDLKSLKAEADMNDEYLNAYAHKYSDDKTVHGPYFFRYEYGYNKNLGLGFILGYSDYTVSATNSYTRIAGSSTLNGSYYQKSSKYFKGYTIGARLNYHFGKDKRLDPYVGCALGYAHNRTKTVWESNDPVWIDHQKHENIEIGLPVYFAASLGARIYLFNLLALYGEFGYDKASFVQAGLVFKFH